MTQDVLNVYLEVDSTADDAASFRPYFQLWGSSATGEAVPGEF